MRIVIDTNLLVSGVISAGPPRQWVDAALTGKADMIASGDKHDLLPLGSYEGIPIVTAREAIERGATGKV